MVNREVGVTREYFPKVFQGQGKDHDMLPGG